MTTAANAWMDYVERAVASIYPNMRPGYDFTWGRRPLATDAPEGTPLEDPSMLYWSDRLQPADMTAIQAKAQEYADTDPQARQEPEVGAQSRTGTDAEAQGRVEPSTAEGENYGQDVDGMIEGEGSPVQRTEEDERREEQPA